MSFFGLDIGPEVRALIEIDSCLADKEFKMIRFMIPLMMAFGGSVSANEALSRRDVVNFITSSEPKIMLASLSKGIKLSDILKLYKLEPSKQTDGRIVRAFESSTATWRFQGESKSLHSFDFELESVKASLSSFEQKILRMCLLSSEAKKKEAQLKVGQPFPCILKNLNLTVFIKIPFRDTESPRIEKLSLESGFFK